MQYCTVNVHEYIVALNRILLLFNVQVNCRGYNAFGRRRREIENRDTRAVEVAESANEGQLREEITIQSNAILTFERREERLLGPTEGKITLNNKNITGAS